MADLTLNGRQPGRSDSPPVSALNDLLPVIQRAAKSVAFQWPGVVDEDDVYQDIWLRLAESDGSVEKILGMDGKAQYRAIVGIGHQLASGERSDLDHFKGSYSYSVYEVKDLLKMGILLDDPPASFRAERVDLVEALAALEKKTPQYAESVIERYFHSVIPAANAAEVRLSRALTSLTDEMNKVSRTRHSERDDGLGTRQILTSAQAFDVSGSDWDGQGDE